MQQLVSNFGHMATVLKCKKCGKFKPSTDYDGSEWQKDRKKRQCKECKPSKKTQTVAAATDTHAPTPGEHRNKEQTTTAAPGIPNTHTRIARALRLMMDASTACMECLSGADTTNTPHLVATREHSMGQTLIENMTVMTRVIADTTQMVKSMCAVNRAISFDD